MTYPGVGPSLRRRDPNAEPLSTGREIVSMDGLKADAPDLGGFVQDDVLCVRARNSGGLHVEASSVGEGDRSGATRVSRFERLQN